MIHLNSVFRILQRSDKQAAVGIYAELAIESDF